MALVKCKECGNEVASSALACPKCGAGCIVLIAADAADETNKHSRPARATAEEPTQVDIGPFLQEYGMSSRRADANYQGRIIQTSGWTTRRGRDTLGSIYVILNSASGSESTSLQCLFSEVHLQRVNSLSQGAHVTIRGRVSGLDMGNVVITNCELVSQ